MASEKRPLAQGARSRRDSLTPNYSAIELRTVPLPAELDLTFEDDDPTEEAAAAKFNPGGNTKIKVDNGMSLPNPRKIVQRISRGEKLIDADRGMRLTADSIKTVCRESCTVAAARRLFQRRVPAYTWLPAYDRSLFKNDLVAGLTVGVVLIPQGVAYAMLAELPPIYGLYSSLLPLPIYAFMCTSKHMSIGPFALVSLLVADSVSEVVPTDSPDYIGAVMLLSLMIGILHCLMAAFNLGIIVRFISDSVLAGFTTAAAILISASQLKHLFGMHIPRAPLLVMLHHIVTHLGNVNFIAFVVGLGGVFLLQWFKDLNKKYCPKVPVPEQLLLLLIFTSLSAMLGLEAEDVPPATAATNSTLGNLTAAAAPPSKWLSLPVVGEVPSGLPQFVPPPLPFDLIVQMLQPTLVVGLFSFILSMSIVRTFALKYEYTTDSNQELYALGVANIVGAFFLSYPIAGSLSRSALVSTAAKEKCTPFHGVISAAMVLLVLLVLTPAFRPMPRACLASIVFMAVKSLFDVAKPKYLYRISKSDFIAWCLSFGATLLLGVQLGIGIGVFASMVLIVAGSTRPTTSVLGRLPRTNIYRDMRRFSDAQSIPGVVIFKFDSSLHFANKDYFASLVKGFIKANDKLLTELQQNGEDADEALELSCIVIEFGTINRVDASALRMLQDLLKELNERGIRLLLCNCNGPVLDVFDHSGFTSAITPASICVSLPEAVKYAARLHAVRVGLGGSSDMLASPDPSPLPRRADTLGGAAAADSKISSASYTSPPAIARPSSSTRAQGSSEYAAPEALPGQPNELQAVIVEDEPDALQNGHPAPAHKLGVDEEQVID